MATTTDWTDTKSCPFCGATLRSAGAGFISHVQDSPDCETEFEVWRQRVAGDIRGGWSG